ncbi:MAG: PAS domain-containing protein, partial [Silvibacterium sp.]
MAAEASKTGCEQRFAMAAQTSLDGFWEVDLRTNQAYFSPRWQMIAGFEAGEHAAGLEHWLTRVHPEDHARLAGELRALRAGKARQMRNEHRLRNEGGMWRWVTVRAVAERNEQGTVTIIAGSLTDQTERKME